MAPVIRYPFLPTHSQILRLHFILPVRTRDYETKQSPYWQLVAHHQSYPQKKSSHQHTRSLAQYQASNQMPGSCSTIFLMAKQAIYGLLFIPQGCTKKRKGTNILL